MMPEKNPSEFTKTLYGCEPEDIAEVVIRTPHMIRLLRTSRGKLMM